MLLPILLCIINKCVKKYVTFATFLSHSIQCRHTLTYIHMYVLHVHTLSIIRLNSATAKFGNKIKFSQRFYIMTKSRNKIKKYSSQAIALQTKLCKLEFKLVVKKTSITKCIFTYVPEKTLFIYEKFT